jgi:hypothetical protein
MVVAYSVDGQRAVADANTDEDRRRAAQAVIDRWKPAWDAMAAAVEAQDVWATAAETGGDVCVTGTRSMEAYEQLREILMTHGVGLRRWPTTLDPCAVSL